MGSVMAVSFSPHGTLHHLDAGDGHYAVGDRVLYPTELGALVAVCEIPPSESDAAPGLPVCGGRASAADIERDQALRARRQDVRATAERLIRRHGLPMQVVGVDVAVDLADVDALAIVYFTAPQRVDFRGLVGELARAVSARIDLRQVGARDAARLTGGIGPCGRELCCVSFLDQLEPVSARLARSQGLSANGRASGACGRLMCCLRYEQPLYVDFRRRAPEIGSTVWLADGPAVVTGHNVPAGALTLRGVDGAFTCPLGIPCPGPGAAPVSEEDAE